tara:strand:- start:1608 stop:3788 length:2181 start_codon:yes stop_codon:yes gene_type:complete
MKISLFLLLFSFSLFGSFNAQHKRVFDPTNAREGETVEYCHQHLKMKELRKNDDYIMNNAEAEDEFQKKLKEPMEKDVIYSIPIVFHVLHNSGVENISDEQIHDALFILNRDFSLGNADAGNVHPDFVGMPANSEIEFILATKAPNGACFKGITRTVSVLTDQGEDGGNQVSAIVSGNDVYNGTWPGNRYLNVFICGDIGGAAGYTYNPGNWNANEMTNGIWLLHNYTGSIGTSSVGTSRTLTHEVGHWLNLSHTWGGDNNPNVSTSCNQDDGVEDTPLCIGVTSCNINSNGCSGDNSYWGFDIRDNVENYMDYSYCSKMFTEGQKERMRAALQVQSTGRKNLWQTSNLNMTGATGVLVLCEAQFEADQTTICAGNEIQFTDASYNAVSTWNWSISPSTGWTVSNETDLSSQNPNILFLDEGMYSITLTASDGSNTDVETKNNYIRVLPSTGGLPFWEGFENYTSLQNLTNWEVVNVNNNNAFTLESSFGHSGTKCARLPNFGQQGSNVDELISQSIDLSAVPDSEDITLSFRYAYRKKTSSDYEVLRVYVSNNCGDTWFQKKTLGGSSLGSSVSSTSWYPTSLTDWKTVHMVNINDSYYTPTFRMKFRFEGYGGNNFYLDDINLYKGDPSDDLVTGLYEAPQDLGLTLYPNPTEKELSVDFDLNSNQLINIEITDLLGKAIGSYGIQGNSGKNTVMLNTQFLPKGTYIIELKGETITSSLPFVKL